MVGAARTPGGRTTAQTDLYIPAGSGRYRGRPSTRLSAVPPVVRRVSDLLIILNFQALAGKFCSCTGRQGFVELGQV